MKYLHSALCPFERRKRLLPRQLYLEALEVRTLLSQVEYFLSIPGVPGDSSAVGHESAIVANSTSWDTMRPEDFLGGAAAFAPLVVDSSISKASPLLFESASAGTTYPTVSLTAAQIDGGTLTDFALWTLNNVRVASYQTNDGAERYALDYTKATISYTPNAGDGNPGTPVQASWDLATQGGSLTEATDLAPGGPAVDAQYFLSIPGVPGDSTASGHVHSIDASSMSFGVSMGAVASSPSFAPLVVDASLSEASPLLFQAVTSGTIYPTVSLTASKLNNGELTTFAELSLSNVTVASYQTIAGAERYVLDYTKADWSFLPQGSGGQSSAPVEESWDLAAQGGTLSQTTDLAPAGPASTAQYFLSIPGVPGGSVASGHADAIDALSMNFGVSAGAVAGDPDFGPLVVDATISQASPLLFEAAAAGTVYPTIEMTAAKLSAGQLVTFAELMLGSVTIATYQTKGGAERYVLNYNTLDLRYLPSSQGGQSVPPVDASWDLSTQGGTLATTKDITPAGTAVTAQYFLSIPGVPGDSTASGHVHSIDASSMSFGVSVGAVASSPSFAAAGCRRVDQ